MCARGGGILMWSFVVLFLVARRSLLEVSKVNKQLRDAIGRATTRVNMAVGIVTSVLPEVVRINVARILGPYLGQPDQAPRSEAAGCPFSGGAEQRAAADEAKCPFTGQSASAASEATAQSAQPSSAEFVVKDADKAADKAASKQAQSATAATPTKQPTKKSAQSAAPKKSATTAKSTAKKPAAASAKAPAKKSATKKPPAASGSAPKISAKGLTTEKLQGFTRGELASVAQELNIAGRSSMRKAELFEAIQKELKLA